MLVGERPEWHARAACFSTGHAPFFDEDDPEPARAVCQRCPIRRRCLEDALEREAAAAAVNRHGIQGGLTGAQRHSLLKRGECCPNCEALLDPLGWVDGWVACDCGWEAEVTPIPDAGDPVVRRRTPA